MLSVLLNDKSANTSYILKKYNQTKMPYTSGLEIKASSVYSICPGKVVAVGRESNKFSVSVLVNSRQLVRYAHLDYADVSLGQDITYNTYIGSCSKYVRFEYCTDVKNDSIWPVRIQSIEMYKHDPYGLIDGSEKLTVYFDNTGQTFDESTIYYDSKGMEDELTDNKGDD